MQKVRFILQFPVLLLMIILTGCGTPSGGFLPTDAVASTPVDSLPVSVSSQQQTLLPTAVTQDIIDVADAEYLLLTNIYQRTSPSVVNIEVVAQNEQEFDLLDISGGSGFIFDREGHIVTNAHVVNGAEEIRVTFNDGFLASAELTGLDTYSDLAVIKVAVDAARLQPLTLGDSSTVRVGERAIAIGNPFGLASSMTVGIVSGVGRNLHSAELIDAENAIPGFQNPSIIQTDTQINPGNSGGPLFNSHGEVIGVNTAIRSVSGIFEGVGFSVPANTVKRVIPEIIERGYVDYAWLGIDSQSPDGGYSVAALAATLNLPVDSGVMIETVAPGSPAEKAGLRGGTREVLVREAPICAGGDIIVAVNDYYVKNLDELVAYLVVNNRPGDTVTLRIVRGDETFDVPVDLEARPTAYERKTCGQ
jgi:S1-C subfamily serine protease